MAVEALVTTVRSRARYVEWNALFVVLSVVHGALLLIVPTIATVGIGLWWNANTISHNFIHRQFFRSRAANRAYSVYLTLLLGIPQSYWRDRHLRHHGARREPMRVDFQCAAECAVLLALWLVLSIAFTHGFFAVYVPGYLLGLGLCFLHGHYEHAGGTTSHYGRLYNLLFFNDGYHVEHHRRPGTHWTALPAETDGASRASRWPAVLRWIECFSLEGLERLVLRWPLLQRFVLHCHRRAFTRLLPLFAAAHRVTIVGGGLFPRTAIILRDLVPGAALTVIDLNPKNLASARGYLDGDVTFVHGIYDATTRGDADVLIVPLAFRGDRAAFYEHPGAQTVFVHDWIWRRSRLGARISWLLLKRLNVVQAK